MFGKSGNYCVFEDILSVIEDVRLRKAIETKVDKGGMAVQQLWDNEFHKYEVALPSLCVEMPVLDSQSRFPVFCLRHRLRCGNACA